MRVSRTHILENIHLISHLGISVSLKRIALVLFLDFGMIGCILIFGVDFWTYFRDILGIIEGISC